MKYIWYAFLGLFSLGFLGLLVCVAGVLYILNYYGSDLPDYKQLKTYQPPIVTRLYAGDGRLMAEFAQEKRIFMPIEKIPDLVKNAFIAAEDKNFYTHQGVDPTAIVRAAYVYGQHLMGKDVNVIGGSTITQQVVKNFLLTNERKFERKIREAILASRIERAMTKDQILELYLNEIFLGYRAYGVAAAGLQYFNKSLDELSVAEAAYLAGLPKAPNNYHPTRHHDRAVKQRNEVIRRMENNGFITEGQAELAKLAPLEVITRDEDRRVNAPYFAEEVRRQLAGRYGEDSLYQGGLAVRTTIDPKLQEIAERALREGLMAYDRRHGYRGPLKTVTNVAEWKSKLEEFKAPQGIIDGWKIAIVLDVGSARAEIGFEDGTKGTLPLDGVKWARKSLNEGYALGPEITAVDEVLSKGDIIAVSPIDGSKNNYVLEQIPLVQGAIIAMDPHTGRILAMQGGWNYHYGSSEFNRATQAQRQPGSAFKPFVYLAALENDFTPATLVLDAPFVIEDRPGNFWSPTNYSNEYYGPTPIRVGVEKSRNLMTVRLADYLGMDTIVDYAKRFGIDEDMPPLLANSLGAGETTLLKLTSAYGELVNGGKKIEPSFIDRIQDRRGKTIFRHDDRQCHNCGDLIRWDLQEAPELPDPREQLVDERHAYQIVSIMEGVVQRGTGVRLKELERPLAGKTGTTNESKDTWFMGFSPDLVTGVFVGFDEPRSLGKRETGSSVALPVFKSFMEEALADEPILPFRIPNGIRNVQINAETGARAQIGDKKVIWEAFTVGTEPTHDMFILDGTGINLFTGNAAYYDYDAQSDAYSPGNPGGYDLEPFPQDNGQDGGLYTPEGTAAGQNPDQLPSRPPYNPSPTTPSETNVGTGGLY
ncbi:MAG TPA: penicillin-binding protein 1A [Alphaproteobacteria bacterium]|nr:penicillin-binding protein 1A [Alphaproteobacteria bacterium]USO05009.1 MAG: penicillin-binding protein 1A [Rhodospirillales bacterium]HOO81898.1 penicillin-binding protein 1A [Alphaproteobacteria bacterium]